MWTAIKWFLIVCGGLGVLSVAMFAFLWWAIGKPFDKAPHEHWH